MNTGALRWTAGTVLVLAIGAMVWLTRREAKDRREEAIKLEEATAAIAAAKQMEIHKPSPSPTRVQSTDTAVGAAPGKKSGLTPAQIAFLQSLPKTSRKHNRWVNLNQTSAKMAGAVSRLSSLPNGSKPSPGRLTYANSLAVDDSGAVFVADSGNNRILKLDAQGNTLSVLNLGPDGPELSAPKGIAAATFGDTTLVAVADSSNDQVVLYSGDGKFLGALGQGIEGFSGFNDPEGITIDPETRTILVADTMNHRVVAVGFDGEVKSILGDPSVLQFPKSVAVSDNGSIYVTNFGKDAVTRFDSNGRLVAEYTGSKSDPMVYPTGIDIDGQGQLWVTEMGSGRVRVLTPDGTTVRTIGGSEGNLSLDHPKSISVQNGFVWVASPGTQSVGRIVFVPAGTP